MSLKRGYSEKTITENIKVMRAEGHSHNQSIAASLSAARKSFFDKHPHGALPGYLIPPGGKRMQNPVPPSSRSHIARSSSNAAEQAKLLYTAFTGHDADEYAMVDKPVIPDVMSVIGDIDELCYTTIRDGNVERYRHKFKKSARPLFCVSPDGSSIHLIGGSYEFGERGIVDKE